MIPNFKQLRAFVVSAQSGTFAEASERLHLSQPALSISIRKLEESVGGSLFARSTRHMTLTPEGRQFLPVAVRLLNDWTEAFEDLSEQFHKRRGKVTVAALPTLAAGVLPRVIAQYRRRYPAINLSVHDVLADHIIDLVREGRADFGLSVAPSETEDITFEPILDDHYVVICASNHPLLNEDEVAWAALAGYPFIGISRASSSRQDIDRVMESVDAELDVLCEVSQLATVARMVAADIGISVLPALSLRQISTHGVAHRPLVDPDVKRPLGIVTAKRRPLSAAGEALCGLTRELVTA